ncbi:unnamed protein product [Prunus armeniaca]
MNIVSSSQTTASTSSSSKIATTNSHSYVLHSSSKKHVWVIDTGATDHMTFDPRQITSHTPSSQSVVSNANGTPSPVIGEGSLSLSDSLTLDSDILSSKMIGCGTRRGKLYYLDLKFDSLSHAYKIGGTSVEKQTSENRHLLEVVRASIFGANMPRSFWGEAVLSAAYLINRIPSSILNFQTPLQTLYHHIQIPHPKNLEPRIFGCVVFVHLHDHQRSKLDPRAEKCVFIGYAPHQKGYRCYHPPSQNMHTFIDVVFREHDIYFSAVHEEHRNANTSQISRLFPSELSHTENDWSHTASDRSPEPPPENDWSLEASDRSPETLP